MKATMRQGTPEEVALEGTPEEISRAWQLMRPSETGREPFSAARRVDSASSEEEQPSYISTTIARAVLRRRPLSREVLVILKALYIANPDTLLATKLGGDINYSRAQFGGLLGAFGRRISHTPGYEDGTSFFRQAWDQAEGCWRYGLPESVCQALRLEGLV